MTVLTADDYDACTGILNSSGRDIAPYPVATIELCYAVCERHADVETYVCVPAPGKKLQKLHMPKGRQLLMECGNSNLDPR